MSKKYLILLILVMIISVGAVSAHENSTDDVVSVDDANSAEDIISIENENSADSDNAVLAESYDDDTYDDSYYEDDVMDEYDYYYEKAVLKPTKLTTTYNSGKTFNVKVVSSKDKSYRLEDVEIKLRVYTKGSYKDYYAYTNYNGIAKFKVSKLALGTHKVQVSSSDYYTTASKVTSKLIIKKANTKVSAPKVTAKYKQSKKFKIKIKDKANNKAVKKVKISVKVGNKKYSLKTNSKGVASFNTKSLKAGTYKVTIKSKNSKYRISAKSKIIIKSAPKKKSKSTSSSGGGYYVASVNSDKFHYSSCGYAKRIKSYNMITFSSRSSAISAGYDPCSRCHP